MSKTYDKYIAPVMTNMDDNLQSFLIHNFCETFRLNPVSMFWLKSKAKKKNIILWFYWNIVRVYSGQEKQITVIANSGQEEIVQNLKKQLTFYTSISVNNLLYIFTQLAENSKVYSSFELTLPKHPVTLKNWGYWHNFKQR